MTVSYGHLIKKIMISYGQVSDFLKSDFLFHIHFSVVICDFLVKSSLITIVLMHVSFKIHYRNNLIDKKNPYLISCPPSWDDHNYLPQWEYAYVFQSNLKAYTFWCLSYAINRQLITICCCFLFICWSIAYMYYFHLIIIRFLPFGDFIKHKRWRACEIVMYQNQVYICIIGTTPTF